MPFDELLAARVRNVIGSYPNLEEKKMFGGICMLINGNMACGVYKNDLIVRVGKESHQKAMSSPNTKLFDITGKAMRGWVMVEPEGCANQEDLKRWIQLGLDFARSLPGK
jgi:TfoX/Sxy family transcriptional regulator of competence genes